MPFKVHSYQAKVSKLSLLDNDVFKPNRLINQIMRLYLIKKKAEY